MLLFKIIIAILHSCWIPNPEFPSLWVMKTNSRALEALSKASFLQNEELMPHKIKSGVSSFCLFSKCGDFYLLTDFLVFNFGWLLKPGRLLQVKKSQRWSGCLPWNKDSLFFRQETMKCKIHINLKRKFLGNMERPLFYLISIQHLWGICSVMWISSEHAYVYVCF